MSTTVDQRVVEMRFDNKQFESAAQTSLDTLEKLKKSLNLEGSTRGLESLKRASNTFSLDGMVSAVDAVSNRFSTMGIVGMTVIANLTTSAMHFAKNMWDRTIGQIRTGGLARAMNIEQAKFQLQGLKVEWDKISDDINYGVKDTAYGLDAAAKAASQLVASGVEFGDTFGPTGNSPMAKALRGISGVAAMTNSSYEEISHIFTTVAGQGKLMGMQLQQFANRGLNVAATLGEQFHVSEQEIREMVTKGKISFADFSQAMDAAFGDQATKANETYSGSLSNVKAALSRIGAKVATVYLEKMRDIFNSLRPVIDNVSKALDPLINAINRGLTWAADKVVGKLNKFNEALTYVLNPVEKLKEETEKAKKVVTDLAHIEEIANKVIRGDYGNGQKRIDALRAEGECWELVQNKVNEKLGCDVRHEVQIEETTEATKKLTEEQKKLQNRYAFLMEVLKKLNAISDNFVKTFKHARDVVAQFGKAIGSGLSKITIFPLLDSIKDFSNVLRIFSQKTFITVKRSFDSVASTAKGLGSVLKFLVEIVSFLGQAFLIIVSPVLELVGGFIRFTGILGDFVTTEIEAFEETNSFNKALKGIKKAIEPVRKGVKTLVDSFFKFVTESKLFVSEGNILTTVFGALSKVIETIWKGISFIASKMLDGARAVKRYVSENQRLNAIFSKLKDGFIAIGGFVLNAIHSIGSFVKAVWELPAVQKIVGKISEAFSNLFDKLEPYLDKAIDKIGEFADKIKGVDGTSFENVLGSINTGLDNLMGNASIAWGNVKSLFGAGDKAAGLLNTIENLDYDFEKLKNGSLFSDAISGGVSEAFKFDEAKDKVTKFANDFKDELGNVNIGKVLGLTFGASSIVTLLNFAELEKSLSKLAGGFAGVSKSISGAISNIFGLTRKKENFSTTAIKIAAAIGIIAGALYLLAQVPAHKLREATNSLLKIIGLLSVFSVVLAILTKTKVLKDKDSGGFKTFTSNIGMMILEISASVFLLVAALKLLEYVDLDNVKKRIWILAALVVMVSGMAVILSKSSKNVQKGSLTLLSMAIAVNILAKTLITLSNTEMDDIERGLKSLAVIMGMLGVLALMAGRVKAGAGLGALGLVLSLILLEKALMYIAEDFRPGLVVSRLKSFAVILGMMLTLSIISRIAGKNGLKGGLGLLAMAGSLYVLAKTMETIASISDADLKKARRTIIELLITMGIVASAIGRFSKGGDFKTIIAVAIAMGVLMAELIILTNIDPYDLAKGVIAIGVVLIAFGYALTGAARINGKVLPKILVLAMMAAVIAEVGFILAKLSKYDWKSVAAAGFALAGVIVTIGLVFAIVSKTKVNFATIGPFTAACLSLLAIAGAISIIAGYDWKSILASAVALSAVILALSAALGVLSWAGEMPLATVVGIGLLDLLVADIILFIEGLGALIANDKLTHIQQGLDTLKQIGKGLGDAIGAFLEGTTSTMPQIGKNLSDFGEKVGGFVESVKGIGTDVSEGAKNLASAILAITGGNILSAFKSETSVEDFGNDLEKLAGHLVTFYTTITEAKVDPDKLNTLAMALKTITDFATAVPNSGGKLAEWLGDNTLDKFGEELRKFAPAFFTWSRTCAQIDPGVVEASSAAAKTVAEFASIVPNQGGLLAEYLGDNTLSEFAKQLVPFAIAFRNYASYVSGINTEVVTATSAAAQTIMEFANCVPNEGGLWGDIVGDNSLSVFANRLGVFGLRFKYYSDIISGVNTDVVTNTSAAIETVMAFADAVPNEGGLISWFTGDNKIDTFGQQLSTFGSHFADYYNNVVNISPDVVDTSIAICNSLLAFKDSLGGDNEHWWQAFASDNKLARFGAEVSAFGTHMGNFYESVKRVVASRVNAVVDLVKALKNITADDGSHLESFSDGLTKLGTEGLKNFLDAFENSDQKVKEAITKFFTTMTNVIRVKTAQLQNEGRKAGLAFVNGLRTYLGVASSIGASYASAFAAGLSGTSASFAQIGSNSAAGYVAGLSSQASLQAAYQAGVAIGNASKQGTKDSTEQESPSKAFARIGRFDVLGYVKGITSNLGLVEEAGEEMGLKSLSAFNSVVSMIAEAIDSDLDTTPTIQPVLDLTNIKNGVSQIDATFSRSRAFSVAGHFGEAVITGATVDNAAATQNFNFTQNNYSPKALSRLEIYRQTKNQFAQMKGAVARG